MVNKSSTPQASKNTNRTTREKKTVDKKQSASELIRTVYYAVWSLVGIAILLLMVFAMVGEDSWVENLNLSSDTDTQETAQTQPQPQQQAQPTQEQLDCVAEEVGQERFEELQQGAAAEDEEEALAIQECLTP